MIVTVDGKEYEIDGIAYGQLLPWRLIKHAGKPITQELFDKLPDADKRALFEHVQQYINKIKRS